MNLNLKPLLQGGGPHVRLTHGLHFGSAIAGQQHVSDGRCRPPGDYERLKRIAIRLVRQWTKAYGPAYNEALADDCVGAGWEALVKHADHRHVWRKVEDAMRDELAKWIYGVTRGQRDRILKYPVPFDSIADMPHHETPEDYAINRDTVARIASSVPSRAVRLWNILFIEGRSTEPTGAMPVLSHSQVFKAKRALREAAERER